MTPQGTARSMTWHRPRTPTNSSGPPGFFCGQPGAELGLRLNLRATLP